AEDRARWDALEKELAGARRQVEARRQAAWSDFEKWLSGAKTEQVAALIPKAELRLHAGLSDGDGRPLGISVDGKPRRPTPAGVAAWDGGHVAAHAFKTQPGPALEVADVGDFDKDQAFSYGAWVKFAKDAPYGAVFARMDDQHDYRGWDLWVQEGRVGTHIIHKW